MKKLIDNVAHYAALVAFFVAINASAQTNTNHAFDQPCNMKPDGISSNLANKVIISNHYKNLVTLYYSFDTKNWATVKIGEDCFHEFDVKTVYIKIYSTPSIYKYYKIESGAIYLTYYERAKKLWQIVP